MKMGRQNSATWGRSEDELLLDILMYSATVTFHFLALYFFADQIELAR